MKEQRDSDRIAAQLLELGNTYKQTSVVEYQGALHIRVARRVVAVYDIDLDTVRVNDVFTPTDQNRVNEVLKIVALPRRLETLIVREISTGSSEPLDSDGNAVHLNQTYIWRHYTGEHDRALGTYTPRETFSCLTGASLHSEAGRARHAEALNA